MLPNVLWLNSDHYAYAHHFALNRGLIHTPTFDALCQQGVLFTNAYTICPLCTPARASLATGQSPHRHGILNNDGRYGSRTDFAPDAPLIARDLKAVGYRPALVGKWHAVGPGQTTAADCGYEGWSPPGYGSAYNNPLYEQYLDELGVPHPIVNVEWHLQNQSRVRRMPLGETSRGVDFHFSSGVIEGPAETHESYFLAHLANRFLEERAADSAPFCLRVDPWGPHQPYYVAAPFAGSVDPNAIVPPPSFAHDLSDRPAHHRRYLNQVLQGATTREWKQWAPIVARCYEHISLVDHALGTVLATLNRLGLGENTLVIYSADHGDLLASHGGGFDKGWLMVEETLRIPLAVSGLGASPGRQCQALVSNLDIVETIRHVTGAFPQNGAPTEGQSLMPLLHNSEAAGRKELMLESHGHMAQKVFQRVLRWEQWKYVASLDDLDELYDLQNDPYELKNLASAAEFASVKTKARLRLTQTMDESDDNGEDAQQLREQLRIE